jgi:hypothetical protein
MMNQGISHMRTPLTVVVAALAVVALAGCVGGPTPPPVAKIEQVDVPDEMLLAEPTASVGDDIVPGSDSLPWLVGGALAQPGEGGAPAVWTSSDGTSWTATPVDEDFKGSFSGVVGGSAEIAALGGTVWKDGVVRSALWTSDDRQTWSAAALPDAFAADFRISDIAVDGSTVFAIAEDVDGASRGLRVEGGAVTEFDLPAVAGGELLAASQVLAADGILMVLAAPGSEGEPAAAVSYLSDDAGKSWGEPSEITPSPGFVSGVARVEGGFVATGGAARDTSSNATGAAAWFSADGSTWASETVAVDGNGPLFYYGSADAWLGAPQSGPAGVTAILGNDNAAVSGVYTRDASGGWTSSGVTGVNSTYGQDGVGVSLDGATTVVLLTGYDYARLGTLAGGSWTDTTTLAARQDLLAPSTIYAGDATSAITLSTPHFTVDADLGWSSTTSYQLGEIADAKLSVVAWDPERAAQLSSVVLATDESGAEVMLGSYFEHEAQTITVEGWFRPDVGSAWTPVAGFPTAGATSFSNVQKIGDTWVAVGYSRASSAGGDSDHGTIWTSDDGVTWAAPGGDFGEGSLESSVVDVCQLPAGGGVAVGWVEESAGEFHAAVWLQSDSGWTRADIGALGTSVGSATACASDDDGVILAASVGGRDTLQRSTDGTAWEEVFKADRGISLGEPVAVPGGFAASGSLTNANFSGPVAWLSANGTDWSPLAIPSFGEGPTWEVAPSGDDLIVTMSARAGHPVMIIRDIERVIADHTG